jgi:signal transduction histidine kinase/DNA-binding response OmpR family regulator
MQEDAVFDNREKIFTYISNNPGSHLRKIARDIKLHLSTLRYHLDQLEKSGAIVSQKQNNLKIYFVPGKLKPEERALTQLLQQKHFRNIILVLIDSPGSTFSQIAEKLSMSRSTASKYINVLEDRKILSHEKIGRRKRYQINDEKSVIELLKTYKRFMTEMSFDIRMPMNDIVGTTSLLLEEKMTVEQRDLVETIRISTDALMAIVNDILDFSKIERDMSELEIKTFNLRSCIEDALQSVSEKATEKRLDLTYEIDKVSPDVIIGDPKKLCQILSNLLDNSVDSTYKGEVDVSVSSKHIDPLYEIHFEIKDTGIGISADKLDRLFNSSRKPDANKASDTDLSTSRGLVELMSGRIWAESKLGEGSKFHFTIKTRHIPNISPLNGIQLPLDGKRILIIVGNKKIQSRLKIQAEDWGMIPITCASGEEALKLMGTIDSSEVAILDVSMSIDNGVSTGEKLHKINKNLPLVALTFAGQIVKPEIYASSLTKPIRQSNLFNALKAALASQSVAAFAGDYVSDSSSHRAISVLLAEDNVSNQKVILSMLRRLGYRAQAVSNGREALQALERETYDILLMDVRMPEMDGLEATRMIRQLWPDNAPKVIAITAYALKGDRERCLAAGMDDYISKPVKMEELKEMLKKHTPH